jgi:DNA-binding HxlR family transcriptional regulator
MTTTSPSLRSTAAYLLGFAAIRGYCVPKGTISAQGKFSNPRGTGYARRMSHIPGQADQRSAADVYSARCPSRAALALIADKWAVLVAGCLVDGPKRHSWLRHRIGGISGKMLTRTLRKLERAGLVERRIFPEVPPRVEYSLSPLGSSLREPVAAITEWAKANGGLVTEARTPNGRPVERAG